MLHGVGPDGNPRISGGSLSLELRRRIKHDALNRFTHQITSMML